MSFEETLYLYESGRLTNTPEETAKAVANYPELKQRAVDLSSLQESSVLSFVGLNQSSPSIFYLYYVEVDNLTRQWHTREKITETLTELYYKSEANTMLSLGTD
jgi:hypothetical protein